ncbi:helix-turn-helix domain-containing protein [Cupriavidus gilardii]|uniref:helix-turn-helix domain-containing protein n=1 Tax=Cupriavidus gilardii TaxID=82541 RepID=UPI001ABE0079|nr:helix-turn-helix domain-containing protein [Cupriavidus gilardii]MBO4123156.1 helix-turn-helix domain-containing protein [Cupriavidus gilardii]
MGRRRIDPSADTDAAADPRFVTALARGLELLRCFRPTDRWLAHQELARRTGLPSATVSRLTFTLAAAGYLRHRQGTGEYALAPGVLSLGFSMLTNFDIGRFARPHMEALAEHTPCRPFRRFPSLSLAFRSSGAACHPPVICASHNRRQSGFAHRSPSRRRAFGSALHHGLSLTPVFLRLE